jgi:6-phosphogluconolactonase
VIGDDRPDPRVETFSDGEALADEVARRLLDVLAAFQATGHDPQIGLTGGTIADVLHRRLATLSPGSGVDWSRVHVWWGDERFVAPDSEDRNALQARRALLDHVDVDPALVHEMPSTDDAPSAEAAADAYSATMRARGTGELDVLMLGIGPDGHCASLFPHHPALDVEDRVATYVLDSPKPPPERVTLTFGALNRSKAVWFLASGEGKAEAVGAALTPGEVRDTPSRGVRGSAETVFFVDEAAAGALGR